MCEGRWNEPCCVMGLIGVSTIGATNRNRLSRAYSYSDRCRYYWQDAGIENESRDSSRISLAANYPWPVSQYLPKEYDRLRSGEVEARPTWLIQSYIERCYWPTRQPAD